MAFCDQCGNPDLRPGARFCPRCGAVQASAAPRPQPMSSSPPQVSSSSRQSWRDTLNKLALAGLALVGVALLVSLTILALACPAPVLSTGSTAAIWAAARSNKTR